MQHVRQPSRPHPADDRCDPAIIALLRAQSPASNLATLDAMWRAAAALVRAGVAAQHPDWPDARISAETARRMAHRTGSAERD
jgi:hypothetical protein